MLRLSESASELTLQAPVWIGLLVLGLGVALAVYVIRGKATGKAFGAGIAALICVAFGWHLLYAKSRFDDAGFMIRGGTGIVASGSWDEVTAVSLQHRTMSRGGKQLHLILERDSGPEVELLIGGLAPGPRGRLFTYVRSKVER